MESVGILVVIVWLSTLCAVGWVIRSDRRTPGSSLDDPRWWDW